MTRIDEEFILAEEELIENPDPRIPIVLALDTSSSMSGKPIAELQKGIETFFEAVSSDEIARTCAEIAIVTFDSSVRTLLDFRAIEAQEIPTLQTRGLTSMGKGVMKALQVLDERKTAYQSAGVDYYQPWLVIMSDGYPTDSIEEASEAISHLTHNHRLSVFPIAIGNADTVVLSRLGGGRPALRLQGLKFEEFFIWLSKSVNRVSQSTPGEHVTLPEGIEAWAQL